MGGVGRDPRPVAVLGATGYVGARLVPLLLDRGFPVRAVGRNPAKLAGRPWGSHPSVELAEGDVLAPEGLPGALAGCGAAFYLVHSMNPRTGDFAAADRRGAENAAAAAAAAGLSRIVYLGGLGEDDPSLSHHLRSRHEVGEILRRGTVPVTELRAAMILGSGSASFEILRYLAERLPVMVTPRWVDTPCQPVAIRNVLHYLAACLDCPATAGETFDIGGPDVVTYRTLLRICAEEAGLPPPRIVPVPVLSPRLSSYWIHLVTPVPASIARPLAEGLRNPVVCRDRRILDLIPQELLGCREAIRLALERTRLRRVESSWSDAGALPPAEWARADDPEWSGGTVYADDRRVVVKGDPSAVWPAVVAIGGSSGWYHADWLWRLRGALDRLLGGPGLGRGRRDPAELRPGDALDFWRVLSVEPERRLELAAEMRLPGEALLEISLSPRPDGTTEVRQRARFRPRGLPGILYWHAVAPFHARLFDGMLRGIARASSVAVLSGPERIPPAERGP